MTKDTLWKRKEDYFCSYRSEDVFIRYDAATGRVYKKFRGSPESPAAWDSVVLCDALLYGDEITEADYTAGRMAA